MPNNSTLQINKLEIIRRSFLIFLPIFVLILGFALLVYDKRTRPVEASLRFQEKTVLALQKKVLAKNIDEVVSAVNFLADSLRQFESVWGNNEISVDERKTLATLMLNFAKAKGIYEQIRIIDKLGMEKICVNNNDGTPSVVSDENLQNKGGRYYFTDTLSLREGEIFVSPLDLNIEHGQIEQPLKPMIRIGTPVHIETGEKVGIILVNYLASIMLERFKELGEVSAGLPLLVNGNGHYLLAQRDEDVWGFMYPNQEDRSFSRTFPEDWNQIRANSCGQLHGTDGLFTYTTINPIPRNLFSSSGSPEALGKSQNILNADEVFWKAISFLPDASYHAEAKRMRNI